MRSIKNLLFIILAVFVLAVPTACHKSGKAAHVAGGPPIPPCNPGPEICP